MKKKTITLDEWAKHLTKPDEFKKDLEEIMVKTKLFILKYGEGSYQLMLESIWPPLKTNTKK